MNNLLFYFICFLFGVFYILYFPIFIFFAAIRKITDFFLYPSKKLHLYGCIQTFLIK